MPKVEHCSLWKSFSTLVKGKAMSVAQLFLSRILIHESQAVKKSRPLEIFPFSICLVFFLEQGRFSSYIACEMHANTHRGFQGPTSRVCFKTLITACRSFCADLSKFAGNIFLWKFRLLIIRCVHVDEQELFFVDKSAEYQNIGYRKNLTYSFTRLSTGFALLTRGVWPASRKWT